MDNTASDQKPLQQGALSQNKSPLPQKTSTLLVRINFINNIVVFYCTWEASYC